MALKKLPSVIKKHKSAKRDMIDNDINPQEVLVYYSPALNHTFPKNISKQVCN
jgi:hypothetical protein